MKRLMLLGAALTLAACAPAAANPPSSPALTASADLADGQGQPSGGATLRETGHGVVVDVRANRLTPGEHGLHVHEFGKCEGPAFTTAGAHFNPTGKQHGHRNPRGPHGGDLGNITAAADGTAHGTWTLGEVTLKQGPANSLFGPQGTSIVIHANPDDEITDPAGNSGPRVMCGVIHH